MNRQCQILLLLYVLLAPLPKAFADGTKPIWQINGPCGRFGVGCTVGGKTERTVLFLPGLQQHVYIPLPPRALGTGVALTLIVACATVLVFRIRRHPTPS
jgi:hypothetical protein